MTEHDNAAGQKPGGVFVYRKRKWQQKANPEYRFFESFSCFRLDF